MKRHPNKLINRRNYRDTRRFLEYCEEVLQNCPGTLAAKRGGLDHVLRWATDTSLMQAPDLRPGLPQYLSSLDLSPNYQDKMLSYARCFFTYAQRQWPERYEKVGYNWIKSLRSKDKPGEVEKREIFTLEHVREIAAIEPQNLTEERTIASVAFLFLSGMRVGAFTTLPLAAVHWDQKPVQVRQWPKLGVRTKFDKAANTYLLAHPDLEDLHQIACRWHEKALAAVGKRGMWFTILTPYREFDPVQTPGGSRSGKVRDHLENLCERTGVEYLPPHKIRHGHVVWALKQCESMDEFKAVSQNIMHKSLTTTDSIYSEMLDDDVADTIAGLGINGDEEEKLMSLMREFLEEKL